MQSLADGLVRTYVFRLELDTLEEAIRVEEQEGFSVKQAHVSSNSYRPPRRQGSEAKNRWTSVMLRVKPLA